jgi:uncharacterized membrane protein YqiK
MSPALISTIVAALLAIFIVFGLFALFSRFFRKVNQGEALIVNPWRGEPEVTFTGRLVLPIVHRAEVMDVSVKTIEIDRRGKEGLICHDNIRADIKVTFFVRVNKTKEDVLKVAQAIGCARASDHRTLEELFIAKFAEALKTVGKQLTFEDLYTKRAEFKDRIVEVIGRDLNGYALEDAAIDFLEQTPLSSLDPHNILDAQGIRKITELTAVEHIQTNSFLNNEKKAIKKQDVEAQEVILSLDRQKADAEARQEREISTVRARESAETLRVQSEERLRAEEARIKADESIAVQEQNKERQVEIAKKNRERAVLVEGERVEKDRALEAISREREVELLRIAKEKALEKERRDIQEVIRERVAVEKTVAEQEENIKSLRLLEEAKRNKDALIISAEGAAQEKLVKDIKGAEAAEQASKFKARERLTLAEAELEASDKEAQARIRLAEAKQADAAADGLARVRVREAEALAIEKSGTAEAKVIHEKLAAEARGLEAQGLAKARVLEAEAGATQKLGLAEAHVNREKGLAEGEAIKARLIGEASGLTEKAAAMKQLDSTTREHEEFRLRIDTARSVELASIDARRHVAEAQAKVLAEAFKTAKIDIVGGDAAFIDRVVNAVSYGKALDGFVSHSAAMDNAFGKYLTGEQDLNADLRGVLGKVDISSEDIRNLSLSALLGRLAAVSDGELKTKLEALGRTAAKLGLSEQPVK